MLPRDVTKPVEWLVATVVSNKDGTTTRHLPSSACVVVVVVAGVDVSPMETVIYEEEYVPLS